MWECEYHMMAHRNRIISSVPPLACGRPVFFVRSSYRVAANKFVTLGLAIQRMVSGIRLDGCRWHSSTSDEVINGTLKMISCTDHFGRRVRRESKGAVVGRVDLATFGKSRQM